MSIAVKVDKRIAGASTSKRPKLPMLTNEAVIAGPTSQKPARSEASLGESYLRRNTYADRMHMSEHSPTCHTCRGARMPLPYVLAGDRRLVRRTHAGIDAAAPACLRRIRAPPATRRRRAGDLGVAPPPLRGSSRPCALKAPRHASRLAVARRRRRRRRRGRSGKNRPL